MLDTHVAIWAVLGSAKLSRSAAMLMEERASIVAVSMVSLWEIALKNNLGRTVSEPIGLTLAEAQAAFEDAGFRILSILPQHLTVVERLERHHGDPFDRLLVSTAIADDYQLITHDQPLRAYGEHVLLV